MEGSGDKFFTAHRIAGVDPGLPVATDRNREGKKLAFLSCTLRADQQNRRLVKCIKTLGVAHREVTVNVSSDPERRFYLRLDLDV